MLIFNNEKNTKKERHIMNYKIITQGCRVNQYDSDIISQSMLNSGFSEINEGEDPDVVIINTCTVTASSDKKFLHLLSKIKKDFPGAITVVTGCFPQAFPERMPQIGADIVVGNSEKERIPQLVSECMETGESLRVISDHKNIFTEPKEFFHSDKTRAYIKIEDGCNRFCSYCIIPTARGRVRSRSLENIARETDFHARDGHKEIVLTGINLSCYGADLGLDIYDAVKTVADNPLIKRVRLSSLEPDMLGESVIEKLASVKKLCPHFHISLQSGCTETLKRMNRHYTAEEYKKIVECLRDHFDNCAITTDVMVGFVGETESEFEQSLNFVQSIGFGKIHVFTYSVRPGTAAEKMDGHVDEAVKAARYKRMSQIAEQSQKKFFSNNLNVVHNLLAERQTKPEYINGHTENFIPVRIYGGKAKRHDIVPIRLVKVCDGYCEGVII